MYLADMIRDGVVHTEGEFRVGEGEDDAKDITLLSGSGTLTFTMPEGYLVLKATVAADIQGEGTGTVRILRDGVTVVLAGSGNRNTGNLYADIQPGETVTVMLEGAGLTLSSATLTAERTEKQVTLLVPEEAYVCVGGKLTLRGTCTNVRSVTVTVQGKQTEATVSTDGMWVATVEGVTDTTVTVQAIGDGDGQVSDEKAVSLIHMTPEIIYASDLEWQKATCHASRSVPTRDRTFDEQHPLTINGQQYAKGIGTHARDAGQDDAEIIMNIPEGAALFEAVVGLDDNMSPDTGNGTVEFIVLLDGEMVARSGIMNPQSPNYRFSVDVTGASTITLRTTNGQDSAAYDACDWCDARFIKNPDEATQLLTQSVFINGLALGENSYLAAGDQVTFRGTVLPIGEGESVELTVLLSAYDANGSLIGRSRAVSTLPVSRTDPADIASEILTVGSTRPARITVRVVNENTHESLYYYEIPSDVMTRGEPVRTELFDPASGTTTLLLDRNTEAAYDINAIDIFGKVTVMLRLSSGEAAEVTVSLYRFKESVINTPYTTPVCTRTVTVSGETEVSPQFSDCSAGEYLLVILPESGQVSVDVYDTANGGVLYVNQQKKEGALPVSIYYYNQDAIQLPATETHAAISSTATSQAEKQRAEQVFNGYLTDLSTLPVSFKIGSKAYSGFGEDFTETGRTSVTNGAKTSVLISLRHTSGLTVILDMASYYDYAAFEWTVYFRNDTDANSPQISQLYAADMTFAGAHPTLNGLYGDAMNESTSEIMNNQPYTFLLEEGKTVNFAPTGGRPSDKNFPYYDFSYGDRGALIAIGWEGQWASSFCYKDGATRFTAKQQTFNAYLLPGETVRTPLVAFVLYDGNNSDRATNLWRHWFIDCNMPKTEDGNLKPALGGTTSDRTGCMTLTNEQQQIDAIQGFYDNGIMLDYWWMDAGWYTISTSGKTITELQQYAITGTWTVDTKRFPTKFRAISDVAMKLMNCRTLLWFEPERFGLDPNELKTDGSTIRKEWLLRSPDGWYFLNYGDPEVVAWITERVTTILEEGGISIYREDHNVPPLSAWQNADSKGRSGITENLYVQGHLQFWDNLRTNFPGMILDTCASGGRRNDLESLRRAIPLHISDYYFYDMNRRQSVHYSLFKWFPYFKAEATPDCHTANEWNLRNAMTAWVQLQFDFTTPGVDVSVATSFIDTWRELNKYFYADYYTLTDWSIEDDQWIGWEFIDPAEGGFAQFFRRAQSPDSEMVIKFKGLDPDAVYELTDVDGHCGGTYTGFELMKHGFTVIIPETNASAIIRIERK